MSTIYYQPRGGYPGSEIIGPGFVTLDEAIEWCRAEQPAGGRWPQPLGIWEITIPALPASGPFEIRSCLAWSRDPDTGVETFETERLTSQERLERIFGDDVTVEG